jgi:hypothetical protein
MFLVSCILGMDTMNSNNIWTDDGLSDDQYNILQDDIEKARAEGNSKYGYGSDNGNGRGKSNNQKKNKDYPKDADSNRTSIAFKFSNRSKAPLHEAVILGGQPVFLTYDRKNDNIKTVDSIRESNRTIKPPQPEEYPYEAYEFANTDQVLSCTKVAREESFDSLYDRAKYFVQEYNDQDPHKQILLACDIVWSYFQDKFSTTHYLAIIGDNGSGKSTVGDTFEAIGYRPVSMTDPTAANLFRVLGTIEPGQCTIIADEAEKIDQSADIMSILKTGYHIKKKVAKTNSNTWKQEFFWTYCFKMIISERAPHQSNAKGVLDRTFLLDTYKGNPQHDIKEVLNPAGDKARQKLLDELISFRKLMLIYRLIHFGDPIVDIEIGLDGRDKELCKPVIQLFYNTKAQKEIETSLQNFVEAKKQRKDSTMEAALYPIIANLVSKHGNEISNGLIWESLKENLEGAADQRKPSEYHTSDFGTIYRNTITNILCDKFGAKRKHKEAGNILIFNPEKLARAGKVYGTKTSIQTRLMQDIPEGSEGSEGSMEAFQAFNENDYRENEKTKRKSDEIIQNIMVSNENIIQDMTSKGYSISPKPSEPSEPSANIGYTHDLDGSRSLPFQCYHCENFQTRNESEYLTHGGSKHTFKPLFPSKADLAKHGLKAQGKIWES